MGKAISRRPFIGKAASHTAAAAIGVTIGIFLMIATTPMALVGGTVGSVTDNGELVFSFASMKGIAALPGQHVVARVLVLSYAIETGRVIVWENAGVMP